MPDRFLLKVGRVPAPFRPLHRRQRALRPHRPCWDHRWVHPQPFLPRTQEWSPSLQIHPPRSLSGVSRRPRVRPQKPQVVQAERAGACLVGRLGVRREGRKEVRSVDRWEVWTVGLMEGRSVDRWEVWTVGLMEGRLEVRREGRLGEQREGFLAGLRTGKVLLREAAQELQCRQTHPRASCRVGTVLCRREPFLRMFFLSP